MEEDRRRVEAGGEPSAPEESENYVGALPEGFLKWAEKNAGRIAEARERGTLPYFLRDNEGRIKRALKGFSGEKGGEKPNDNIKNPLPEEVKKRREEIREEARKTIVGNPIYLPGLDRPAVISNKGVKEWLNQPHAHIAEKNELILDIQKVLDNSKYVGSGVDKHSPNAYVHLFEIEILGDRSWIVVREFYNSQIIVHSISDNVDILKMIETPSQ